MYDHSSAPVIQSHPPLFLLHSNTQTALIHVIWGVGGLILKLHGTSVIPVRAPEVLLWCKLTHWGRRGRCLNWRLSFTVMLPSDADTRSSRTNVNPNTLLMGAIKAHICKNYSFFMRRGGSVGASDRGAPAPHRWRLSHCRLRIEAWREPSLGGGA